jgi:hypothetical protein
MTSDRSYLEIARGIANAITRTTTLTRMLHLSPRVVHGVFRPEVEWDGVDVAVGSQRYGVDLGQAYKVGDGEAFFPDSVLEVALHPLNPLGINQSLVTLRPGGGIKDTRIYTDCMIVGTSPESLVWRWFQARRSDPVLFPPVDPPTPTDPPQPPVTPPHVCPPAWQPVPGDLVLDAEKIAGWDAAEDWKKGRRAGAVAAAKKLLAYHARQQGAR